MNRARDSCLSSPPNKRPTQTPETQTNYYSPLFLDTYIWSVTALEAFINEQIALNLRMMANQTAIKRANPIEKKHKVILEMLIEQELVTKYRLMPILLWQKIFDESRSPFQDFKILVSIRNDIIHYKMPFYDKQSQKPKWTRKVEEKGILLSQPLQRDRRVWIEEICTLEGARWSYNTCYQMIKEFIMLSDGIIRFNCQDYLESLQEL
jgi:hypothetical protein